MLNLLLCDDSLRRDFSQYSSSLPPSGHRHKLFDHFGAVTCYSRGGADCEQATPHAGKRVMQKENKTCSDFVAQQRGNALPPDHLDTIISSEGLNHQ